MEVVPERQGGGGVVEPCGAPRRSLTPLRALSERGLARAAASLGRMLGSPVRFTLREVHHLPSSALTALAEGLDSDPVAGLRIRMQGEGDGWILILLPLPSAYRILQRLTGTPAEPRDLTEIECSAVEEVGNIVASSFLSELGDVLGRRFFPSAPELHLDNTSRLVRDTLASLHTVGTEVLVVHALLEDAEGRIQGQLFVVPDVDTLQPVARGAVGELGACL